MGDPTLAMEELGWKPKNTFDSLVKKMVIWDIECEREKRAIRKITPPRV